MDTLRIRLRPLAAFGTPLAGDTLFGQLCWAVRERHGETQLTRLLEGYHQGQPFLVVSDGLPAGWLPKPMLPEFLLGTEIDPAERKALRQRNWLPADHAHLPLRDWVTRASSVPTIERAVTTQNTINRLTGTTGSGPFAPRQVERQHWAGSEGVDLYCCIDPERLDATQLAQLLGDIGQSGFGRDASTGLGKFSVSDITPHRWPTERSRHALTLAPCAPDVTQLDARACYYAPLTRFGRHGNFAATGLHPFKRPVLTLRSGAFLSFATEQAPLPAFHGTGLGGLAAPVSFTLPATVHQGYAPLVPLNAELHT